MAGCLIAALTYFPLFKALTEAANPELAAAQAKNKIVVKADPAQCSFQGSPIAREIDFTDLVRHRQALPGAKLGQLRQRRLRRPARPATVKIGDKTVTPPAATVVNQKFDADSTAKDRRLQEGDDRRPDRGRLPRQGQADRLHERAVVEGRRDPRGSW